MYTVLGFLEKCDKYLLFRACSCYVTRCMFMVLFEIKTDQGARAPSISWHGVFDICEFLVYLCARMLARN